MSDTPTGKPPKSEAETPPVEKRTQDQRNELLYQTARLDAAKQRAAADAAEVPKNALLEALSRIPASTLVTDPKTTVQTGATDAEATLLSAREVERAADLIAEAVKAKCNPLGPVVVWSGARKLSIAGWIDFKTQAEAIKRVFDATIGHDNHNASKSYATDVKSSDGSRSMPKLGAAVAADVVDAAVALVTKVGSYFFTEYTLSSATVTGIEDDLLATCLAGRFDDAYCPSSFPGLQALADVQTLLNEMADRDAAVDLRKTGADEESKKACEAAQTAYRTLLGKISVEGDGALAIVRIAEEKLLADLLERKSCMVLLVKRHTAAGGNYTKKNLWTSILGFPPVYVMGSTVASWLALDGQTGRVIGSGQVALHSGYHRLDKIESA
jgi:hypothetical protein